MATGWHRRCPLPYRPSWVTERLLVRAGKKRVRRRERNLRWLASGGVLPR